MIISNHTLQDPMVTKIGCPKNKEKFKLGSPNSIVIKCSEGSSIEDLARNLAKDENPESAHILIGRKGEIFQLVPFDTISWHTKKIKLKPDAQIHFNSFGIVLENSGFLNYKNDVYKTQFGKTIPTSEVIKAKHQQETKERYWQKYTYSQLKMCKKICQLLIENYTITNILGFSELSNGKHLDPGPAFPLEDFKSKLLDHFLYNPVTDNNKPENIVSVNSNSLVLRVGPGEDFSKIPQTMGKGKQLTVIQEKNNWLKVETKISGWVEKNKVADSSRLVLQ